jgi:HYR domain
MRLLVVLVAMGVACGALVLSPRGDARTAGMLTFQAQVAVNYPQIPCPPGTRSTVECFVRTGTTTIAGLGTVQQSYAYLLDNGPEGCPAPPAGAELIGLPPSTARLIVAGKGEIDLRTSGADCLARFDSLTATEQFTVTGGSGMYAGASGGGTVTVASLTPLALRGTDTWSGTLVVAGLEFDLAAPKLVGATSRKVIAPRRARSVRVTFKVTATDDVDGQVPVACRPRSGSRFPIGRRVVRCSATDTSGNTARANFAITVKARR